MRNECVFIWAAGMLAVSLMVAGCGGGGGGGEEDDEDDIDDSPIVSLSATRSSVEAGQSTTLTWTSSKATSCVASGAWSGSKELNGIAQTGALLQTSTYTLTCSGPGGTAARSETISVVQPPPPDVTLSVDHPYVPSGSSVVLSWATVAAATDCAASGAWSGSKPASGSETIGPLKANGHFTLTCKSGARDISGTIGVAVQPPFQLLRLDLMEVKGRTLHEGLFPIARAPVAGESATFVAAITGLPSAVTLTLVDAYGAVLQESAMSRLNGDADYSPEYYAQLEVPDRPFRAELSASSSAGETVYFDGATVLTPVSFKIVWSTPTPIVAPGAEASLILQVTNFGTAADFNVSLRLPAGLASTDSLQRTIHVDQDDAADVVLVAKASNELVDFDQLPVTATVSDAAHINSASEASLTLEVGTTEP